MALESLRPDASPNVKNLSTEIPENGREDEFDIKKIWTPEKSQQIYESLKNNIENSTNFGSLIDMSVLFPEKLKQDLAKPEFWNLIKNGIERDEFTKKNRNEMDNHHLKLTLAKIFFDTKFEKDIFIRDDFQKEIENTLADDSFFVSGASSSSFMALKTFYPDDFERLNNEHDLFNKSLIELKRPHNITKWLQNAVIIKLLFPKANLIELFEEKFGRKKIEEFFEKGIKRQKVKNNTTDTLGILAFDSLEDYLIVSASDIVITPNGLEFIYDEEKSESEIEHKLPQTKDY